VNVHLLARMHGTKSRNWVSGIGDAELAAKRGRRDSSMMIRDVQYLRIGHGPEKIANQAVEFGIGDEMGGLLLK
jgi:hypothetical protein